MPSRTMNSRLLTPVLVGFALGLTSLGADIVDRPEKLNFPP